jgi:hypothetical protein
MKGFFKQWDQILMTRTTGHNKLQIIRLDAAENLWVPSLIGKLKQM